MGDVCGQVDSLELSEICRAADGIPPEHERKLDQDYDRVFTVDAEYSQINQVKSDANDGYEKLMIIDTG